MNRGVVESIEEKLNAYLGPKQLPAEDTDIPKDDWGGAALAGPIHRHDFSYVADYGSVDEAVAINGRLLGPAAAAYLAERRQATVAWRLRIHYARVARNRT